MSKFVWWMLVLSGSLGMLGFGLMLYIGEIFVAFWLLVIYWATITLLYHDYINKKED